MFRRSRFSVRPNVGTTGRTAAATPQETPSANPEASEAPKDASENIGATTVTDSPSEKAPAPGDGCDPNGEGTSSSAAVQRRKRFSIKPKVAPGRPSTLSRTPKSPAKAASEPPAEVSASDLDKPTTSSQTGATAAPQGLQSPRRRRPSEDTKKLTTQPKPTPISSDTSAPSVVPSADDDSLEQTPTSAEKRSENVSCSQVKEVPPRPPDKVLPSLPDKEAIEISEKAKTLVSSKNVLSLTPSALSLSRLLNSPSDLQRLVKAQKLRELLRQERHKEKKLKQAKVQSKEYSLDPAKMTMRDLIRYLPTSNPMTSSLEDAAQENDLPSPERQESPERAQEPEVPPNKVSSQGEEEEEEEEEVEKEQEEALMVPQVKVAEDGSLIIDEESLTVEVLRAKGPNPAHSRDPIFERGSTTTYSSFRKGTYSKPWTSEETDMFFLAVSMVGTDFSMICQLFPHRGRSEIKNKFKKEERANSWRIDKAFRERRKLDIEYFSKLLEKVLEVQKNMKKLKSLAEKNSPKKRQRKAKAKKSAKNLSDVEEGDEEDDSQLPDLEEEEEEEEGEKENEDLCNEGGLSVSEPKRKGKRKKRADSLTEEPSGKKNKASENSNEQGEASIPEDTEAALPDDHTDPDMSEKAQNVSPAKDATIKPAKLSRGRAPKPLVPLGRKWGKKPPPATKAKDPTSDKDEGATEGASKEQENDDASPLSPAKKKTSASDDMSSEEEEEDATVKPPKPTRYGRVPKPTKPLTYPTKEDAHSSASETTPASPPPSASTAPPAKPKSKRGRPSKPQSPPKSKKPKLVTLRASQSEFSDDENEKQWQDEEVLEVEEEVLPDGGSSRDSGAPVFVPSSLHTPQPVTSEVDETMVELDILASMPDVLGISQDALCPDSTCEQAQHETGTAEPCEHQLDLLVDVIDFLSTEHTEVTEDESYNEAAQTLLTIGNLAHLSQSAQSQIQDLTTGMTSAGVNEIGHLEEDAALNPVVQEQSATPSTSAASGLEVTETSEAVVTVEQRDGVTDGGDVPVIKPGEPTTVCEVGSSPSSQSVPESSIKSSPQAKRGRLSKVKPKPNLGRTSRATQQKSQPETSAVRTTEEIQSAAPDLSRVSEMSVGAEQTKTPECSPALVKDDISTTVRQTEEPSVDSQEKFVDHVESGAATSDSTSSEIQSPEFSESQVNPVATSTSEPTDEKCTSPVRTADSNNPATSESTVTDVEHGSCTDPAPVQESSDKPSSSVSPAVDSTVDQKPESEAMTVSQSRRSQLQKVKPKPNLPLTSRAARSKQPVEKDSDPNTKSLKGTTANVEPTCTSSPDPASGSSLPAEEQSTLEELKTNVGLVEVESSGNQNLPEAQVEPTRNTSSSSEFVDKNLTSHPETSEGRPDNVVTTESQVGQNVGSAPVQGGGATLVTPVDELPISQGAGGEVASTCQLRRSRLQRPKPNLPQKSRTAPSTKNNTTAEEEERPTCSTALPEIKSTASVPLPSQELSSYELSSAEKEKAEVGEASKTDVPAGRRWFSRVKTKPNVRSSPRSTLKKQQSDDVTKPSDQSDMDASSNVAEQRRGDDNNAQTDQKLPEKDLTSAHCSLNLQSASRKSGSEDSEKTPEGSSPDCVVVASSGVAGTPMAESVPEDKSSKNSTVERESADLVEAGPASQRDNELDTRVSESNTQQIPAVASDVQKEESKSNPVLTPNANPACSEGDASVQSTDDSQSELTDSPKPLNKAPQVRRGRPIKPKPNLGSRSRPAQPQQAQKTTKPAGADSGGSSSQGVDPVSTLRSDLQEPVGRVIDDPSKRGSASDGAGSSLGCLAQVEVQQSEQDSAAQASLGCVTQVSSLQNAPPSNTEGIQGFSVFSDMLPDQVPSDPDEPFFILSLTEIPVSTPGDVSYLPVTDASMQQPSSVSGQSLAAAAGRGGDGSVANVPVSTEDTGLISGGDTAACTVSTVENPNGSTTIQLLPNETETPPTKQRPAGAGRRAKPQVRSSTARKKQNLTAEESVLAQTNQDPEPPGLSVMPKASDDVITELHAGSSGRGDADEETVSGSQRVGASSRKRKPKDFPSFTSETNKTFPSIKAASRGSKAATRGRPSPEPAVTGSCITPPTPAEVEEISVPSPNTSDQTPCTSQSVCVEEEEEEEEKEEQPTSVSQYFLSDIFTEVEEG